MHNINGIDSRFWRCSGVAWTSFMAISLKPRCSKREMMFPTRPRWTPSGYRVHDVVDARILHQDGRSGCDGTHLDHDIRALVIVRHDRYVFLWLMQLTIGEEREMGSCEKERADFKQQKVDHRFCLPNSEIAARPFFLPTVMLCSHTCQLCPPALQLYKLCKRSCSVLLACLSLPTCAPLAHSPNG